MPDLRQLSTVTNYQPALPEAVFPPDGTFIGRAWLPASGNRAAGPRVIGVKDFRVFDLSTRYPTTSHWVNDPGPLPPLESTFPELDPLEGFLQNSFFWNRAGSLREETRPVLLAPNDLLATRACGVTFVRSLLERVVEEQAKGDPARARDIRHLIEESLGNDLSKVHPGSPETVELKARLQEKGLWSQYLEVGIGPDAEIFTKTAPMASVGFGAQVGVLPASSWNNPEPEVVLAVSRTGTIRGATLGNDVNLRDYEGRSALLLGEAKDQNGSCAIGPLIRVLDDTFRLEDLKQAEIELSIWGPDGFHTSGVNRMAEISRSPESLVAQAIGPHHQYPDGLMLFLGTMFAPTEDRKAPGLGFTHEPGDRVEIATPALGRLVNWVNHTNAIPPWDYGITDLLEFLKSP